MAHRGTAVFEPKDNITMTVFFLQQSQHFSVLKREKISRFPCNCNETDRKIIVNKRQLIAKVVNLDHTTTIKPLSLTSLNTSTKGVIGNASDKVNTAPKDFESFLSQFDFSDTCYTGKDF